MNKYKYDQERKALVIFSGGMDSTVCLYWAIKEFGRENVSAVTFDYAQRHSAEIESARKIAELAGISWRLVVIPGILSSSSPLVSDSELEQHAAIEEFTQGLQPTFVPARNMLFFTIAANIAYELGAMHLVTGVCEADYGGYYDCRQDFVRSMQETINLALLGHRGRITQGERMLIHTPLMHLSKREELLFARSGFRTVAHIQERRLFASRNFSLLEERKANVSLSQTVPLSQTVILSEAKDLRAGTVESSAARDPRFDLAEECLEALGYSHSCYAGVSPGCGKCHACHLRARAFEQAGLRDPLFERAAAAV